MATSEEQEEPSVSFSGVMCFSSRKPQESEGCCYHAAQPVRKHGSAHFLLPMMRLLSSVTEIRFRLNPYSRLRRPDFPRLPQ